MDRIRGESNDLDEAQNRMLEMFPNYFLLPKEEQKNLLGLLYDLEHQKEVIAMKESHIAIRQNKSKKYLNSLGDVLENFDKIKE